MDDNKRDSLVSPARERTKKRSLHKTLAVLESCIQQALCNDMNDERDSLISFKTLAILRQLKSTSLSGGCLNPGISKEVWPLSEREHKNEGYLQYLNRGLLSDLHD